MKRNPREIGVVAAVAASLVAATLAVAPAAAQQVTGVVGFAQRHDHDRRETTPASRRRNSAA